MAFEQTRDVMKRVRTFHHQLSELYHQMSETTEKPRMKLLLDYMSRHETALEECVQGFERLAGREVLDAWFQFTPHAVPPAPPCEGLELGAECSVGDIVRIALEFDACLLKYYQQLVDEAPSEALRDLFRDLLVHGKREAVELSRSALEVEQL
jgi:hypothetical protein